MRFNLLNIFSVIAIVALATALVLSNRSPEMVLIGGHYLAWDLDRAVAADSKWDDKTTPPNLSVPYAYAIGTEICQHLEGFREKTLVDGWQVAAISFERMQTLGENSWGYRIRLEGVDYPEHEGQSVVEELSILLLLDRQTFFDYGSCPTDELAEAMMANLDILDATPNAGERPTNEGGVF